jgi:hypothetical protein
MSTVNTLVTRKGTQYINQTIIEQNNSKKAIKEQLHGQTSKYAVVQEQFLICQLCFWCASYYAHSMVNVSVKFDIAATVIAQCPSCDIKGKIQSLPISHNKHPAYGEHS